MLDAVAIVYDPPRAGLPHLAALFGHGQMIACKPVGSIDEGEAYLKALIEDLCCDASGREAANDDGSVLEVL